MSEAPISVAQLMRAIDDLVSENARLKRDLADRKPVDNRKKLTDREVANIRAMHRTGVKQKDIADVYDVNHGTISRIVRGQYHK